MTFRPERFLSLAFLGLFAAVAITPTLDWWNVRHLPTAAVGAVESRLPGAKLDWVQTDRAEQQTVYELHGRHEGSPFTARVTPAGHLIEVSRSLGIQTLPGDLRDTLHSRYSSPRVRAASLVTNESGADHYEVEVRSSGQTQTLVISREAVAENDLSVTNTPMSDVGG